MVAFKHPTRVRARRIRSTLETVRYIAPIMFVFVTAKSAIFNGSAWVEGWRIRLVVMGGVVLLIALTCHLLLKRWIWLIDASRDVVGEE
jgi:hypothetical protein